MISKEQQEFYDYVNSIKDYVELNSGENKLRIKKVNGPIYFNNNATDIASVFPSDTNNLSVMVVNENFFNLEPKTQKFVIGHEMAHMTTGISTPEYAKDKTYIAETRVDLATGLSKDEIIDALNDLRENMDPGYEQSFNSRIDNIINNKVSVPTEGIIDEDFFIQTEKVISANKSASNIGGSSNKKPYKSKRTKERELKRLQEKIAKAQKNPLYADIYELIKEAEDIDEAKSLLNKGLKDNPALKQKYSPSEYRKFLNENADTFFNEQFGRVPFLPNADEVLNTRGKIMGDASSAGKQAAGEASQSTTKEAAKEAAEQATKQATGEAAEEVVSEGIEDLGETNIGKIFNKRTFSVGLNSFFAISDYKSAREEGKGVVGSAVKAGATFVAGEILGPAYPLIGLAKAAPKMAISGIETMQRMTRQMNSVQRIQTFGEAQFQDTQQLATMRQAGMELAKMSQYNLQQSIMGNEAQYMHRI